MLIDTHAHLDAVQFQNDQETVIENAQQAGIQKIVNIGFNRETITSTIALTEKYEFIFAAIGWHPQEAEHMKAEDLEWIEKFSKRKKVVAIGEIGLDYFREFSEKSIQQEVFRAHIQLAKKMKLPIVIHNREAHQDVLKILKEEQASDIGGIMHCFSGSWETAKQCLDMNFYISFGGPITFKNAKQPKEVLSKVPIDRLLIETDCPYLAPDPYRGKRNESAFIKIIAEEAARIRGMSLSEFALITTENAERLLFSKL